MRQNTPATKHCARVLCLFTIAFLALFATVANAAPVSVLTGTQFTTTTGTPIQAHGGGVIKVGPYYYWFGENRNPNSTFFAVSCYRSTDLMRSRANPQVDAQVDARRGSDRRVVAEIAVELFDAEIPLVVTRVHAQAVIVRLPYMAFEEKNVSQY